MHSKQYLSNLYPDTEAVTLMICMYNIDYKVKMLIILTNNFCK